MGEEVNTSEYETNGEDNGDEDRVYEWEMGLPNADDLTPLSQSLIPAELASAFSIAPEPYRTIIDVNRESRNTLSTLRGGNKLKSFTDDPMIVEEEEDNDNNGDGDGDGSETRKLRKLDSSNEEMDTVNEWSTGGKAVKRPRLVWTPQLHKRFVEVVGHIGIKNAVPKTIMQLMNVEGLTRENVASHLQKYRLYLKRMQVGEGPSSAADQLFASTHESGGGGGGGPQGMQLQMPVYGYHHRNLGFEAADSYKYYPQRFAPNDN